MDRQAFEHLMHTIARAWTDGDPAAAVACFAEDIIYIEPPDKQRYVGHAELYELSAGAGEFTWHHLIFDPEQGIGCGEYTYRGRRRYHGITIVRISEGKVSRWREYQYISELEWSDFAGDSR